MSKVYEQSGDYMPRTDDGFYSWLHNFSSLLSADPDKYGMTKADADVIANHFDAYAPLWSKCQQPSVRTTSLIQQKDAVKASAMASCRVYVRIIKNNFGVDVESRSALGLRIDDTTRTPIPAPATAPVIWIAGIFSGEHYLRYADETTPSSRRKPYGTKFIEIWSSIDHGPNPDLAAARLIGSFGRQPIKVRLTPDLAGKTATYSGRWVNTRGVPGPWSLPVTMTIAFGGPLDLQGGKTIANDGNDERAMKMAA